MSGEPRQTAPPSGLVFPACLSRGTIELPLPALREEPPCTPPLRPGSRWSPIPVEIDAKARDWRGPSRPRAVTGEPASAGAAARAAVRAGAG